MLKNLGFDVEATKAQFAELHNFAKIMSDNVQHLHNTQQIILANQKLIMEKLEIKGDA